MRLQSLALGLLAAVSTTEVAASPITIPSLEDAAEILEKRQQQVVTTTGASGSQIYPRLEVRQMQHSRPNQWTLLLLALHEWHAAPQNDAASYYQIAGIHGVPRQNYNNVGQCSTCGDADGYCTHDSVLFPAWHRAYMALFEQQFLAVVKQIVALYPQSQQAAMQGALSTMRWPYWDWAAQPPTGTPTLPTLITDKYVTVTNYTGEQVTIINPLFRHDFQDPSQMYYQYFVDWPITLRYPNSDAPTASSTNANATAAFDNIRHNLQDQLYQLFSTCSDYLHFSNDDAGSSSTSCSNSLEGIHATGLAPVYLDGELDVLDTPDHENNVSRTPQSACNMLTPLPNTVHTTSGGPGSKTVSAGHMTYLATAAFDPIFWLHHCNVDRLFALWQSQHPGVYGASQVQPHDSWTIPGGSTQDANSPLTPFLSDTNGNYWTTNKVQQWNTTFHYTYPEFYNTDGSKGAVASLINGLYGPSATLTAGSGAPTAPPPGIKRAVSEAAMDASPLVAGNRSSYAYIANIKSPRYALNGSYYIFLFHDSPSTENPTEWVTDSNLIGPMGVLAQANKTEHTLVAAGSVPLTRTLTALYHAGALPSLTEADAVPYLQKHLQWRIVGPDGNEIDPSTVPGFEISVFASTTTVGGSDFELPKFSEFIPLVEITQNKAGGANNTFEATIGDLENSRLGAPGKATDNANW